MKYFISQPMKGKTDEEIKAKRNAIIARCKALDDEAEIIDSFFERTPHDASPLWFLGKSIQLLSKADVACFAEGWEKARGCKLEHECAKAYGITCFCETKDGYLLAEMLEEGGSENG